MFCQLPLMGGIKVNPVGPLGRRLCARHDVLSWEHSVLLRRVRAEWASYK